MLVFVPVERDVIRRFLVYITRGVPCLLACQVSMQIYASVYEDVKVSLDPRVWLAKSEGSTSRRNTSVQFQNLQWTFTINFINFLKIYCCFPLSRKDALPQTGKKTRNEALQLAFISVFKATFAIPSTLGAFLAPIFF